MNTALVVIAALLAIWGLAYTARGTTPALRKAEHLQAAHTRDATARLQAAADDMTARRDNLQALMDATAEPVRRYPGAYLTDGQIGELEAIFAAEDAVFAPAHHMPPSREEIQASYDERLHHLITADPALTELAHIDPNAYTPENPS